MEIPSHDDRTERLVSTGALPERDQVEAALRDAHARYSSVDGGEPSDVYPALASADPSRFGIAIAGVNGRVVTVGDAGDRFPLMSVAKPFVFALVCDLIGADAARRRLGVNATGLPFNAIEAVERTADGRTNPMVNSGAIATTALTPGTDAAERWEWIRGGLSRFAGRDLAIDIEVYRSASATNLRNRDLTELLDRRGALEGDPAGALDLYTRQSCLSVSSADLAVMGATLADGGVNPVTGERVVEMPTCRYTLAVMATAGLYEASGDWLYDVGLPGKSGIGGGIVTVSPGKGGLGVFSPPLDAAGNSVRGQLVAAHLARSLGLDLFASTPHR